MFYSRRPLALFCTLFFFIGLIAALPAHPKGRALAHAPAHPKGRAPVHSHMHPKGRAPAHAPAHRSRSSSPSGAHCPSNLRPRGGKIFIGYNGFNGTPRNPQASAGGELGAVFYVADAVDLAKAFAHGADSSKDYVCMVYADADAWAAQPKVWVPSNAPLGNAMNSQYPGAVLFAQHTNAGLPAGSPNTVHQLGVRQAQIARLGLTVECVPKSCFATDHDTLEYDSLMGHWNIQAGR